jgi:hypothetical protein
MRHVLRTLALAAALFFVPVAADAGVLDASWTAPTTNQDGTPLTDLAGYRLYYGTSPTPCPGSTFLQVTSSARAPQAGQRIGGRLMGLAGGTLYYVSVTAVDTAGAESPCLSPVASAAARMEVSVNAAATLNFGSAQVGAFTEQTFVVQNIAGTAVSGTVSVSSPFSVVSGGTFTLNTTGASQTVRVRFTPTIAATASSNLVISANGDRISRTLTGTGTTATPTTPAPTPGTADTTRPTVGVTALTTTATTISVSGNAADNLAVSQVTWVSNRGGSGTAAGTTAWSASGIPLLSGTNVVTVTARDSSGNTATATVTVTVPVTSTADTTQPTLTVMAPTTSGAMTTTSSTVSLAGTAADNVGVTQVTWANNRGGSGTASGTTSWSASVPVVGGTNVVTVTARDAAGNTSTASLTVTVSVPSTTDTTRPTITVTGPTTSGAISTTNSTLTLSGRTTDNVGVTQVTWANNRGGTGAASGTASWTASGIRLVAGANVITVTARDAAGNTATSSFTATLTDATAPTIAITSPTTSGSISTTSSSLRLAGTAADNFGVTQVTWRNSLGGSGTASGTTSWSTSIPLRVGSNVITVTARDAAGLTRSATFTATMTAPAPAPAPAPTYIPPVYDYGSGYGG